MKSSATDTGISSFSDEIRQAREFKRISLKEVAESTRIREDYLAAIERGLWGEIPSAYLRGYIAQFAQAVGMNRDKVLVAFDGLITREQGGHLITVEREVPLLKGPQHVELTRSKIRTEWFAALYRKRALAYLVSVGLIIATYYGVSFSRRLKGRNVDQVSFEQALTESERHTYAPYSSISAADSLVTGLVGKPAKSEQVTLVITRPCIVVSRAEGRGDWIAEATWYDTLRFSEKAVSTILVSPAGSALLYGSDGRGVGTSAARGDTSIFVCSDINSASLAQEVSQIDTIGRAESPP
jgi:transcriptional regulator with XRE-family HTH domain